MRITGKYYFASSVKFEEAFVELKENKIRVKSLDGKILFETKKNSTKSSDSIIGVSSKLEFVDGSSFVPDDTSIRWDWGSNSSKFSENLSKNKNFIVSVFILLPLIIWFIGFQAMPKLASNLASKMSDESKGIISENVMKYLEKENLSDSIISFKERDDLETYFYSSIEKLGIDKGGYELLFYSSQAFGANAIALPDGKIILTDQLYKSLADKPDAILAILLHEVGHVEYNHGLSQIIQSIGIGLIFTFISGDVQGLSEALVGSSYLLLQQSFSREMEKEADIFSVNSLKNLNISPDEFVTAMETFLDDESHNDFGKLMYLEYLSSHPNLKERIEVIKSHSIKD